MNTPVHTSNTDVVLLYPFHSLLKAEQVGSAFVVTPQADGIGFRYADLQTELNRLLLAMNGPMSGLVVDLGSLNYFGTEFLGAILSLMNHVGRRGRVALWCNASEGLIQFFHDRGVSSLFPYFYTRDDALQWLLASQSA